MIRTIDLRSDTVTRPTTAMRGAMAEAEVGDDVYGEDPTVNRLEAVAAERLGKEAALLCPSGVMANQLALRALAEPGSEVIVEQDAHLVNYEDGAGAVLGGVQFRTLPSDDGVLRPEDVSAAIRPDAYHLTPTSLVTVEQTHNRRGGTVTPLDRLAEVMTVARERGVSTYIDGARIFNAAIAAGVEVREYAAHADALMFSLSKGLGAPVGSVLVGDDATIERARRWRRRYGGAMRQAGVIAAAGLHALDHHVERLADDHRHARSIAEALEPTGATDPSTVATNMVYVTTGELDAPAIAAQLAEERILVGALGPSTLRLVTHLDVDEDDCRRTADELAAALSSR